MTLVVSWDGTGGVVGWHWWCRGMTLVVSWDGTGGVVG